MYYYRLLRFYKLYVRHLLEYALRSPYFDYAIDKIEIVPENLPKG